MHEIKKNVKEKNILYEKKRYAWKDEKIKSSIILYVEKKPL